MTEPRIPGRSDKDENSRAPDAGVGWLWCYLCGRCYRLSDAVPWNGEQMCGYFPDCRGYLHPDGWPWVEVRHRFARTGAFLPAVPEQYTTYLDFVSVSPRAPEGSVSSEEMWARAQPVTTNGKGLPVRRPLDDRDGQAAKSSNQHNSYEAIFARFMNPAEQLQSHAAASEAQRSTSQAKIPAASQAPPRARSRVWRRPSSHLVILGPAAFLLWRENQTCITHRYPQYPLSSS